MQIPGPFLSPDLWQKMPLIGKEVLSHNTRRFRCACCCCGGLFSLAP